VKSDYKPAAIGMSVDTVTAPDALQLESLLMQRLDEPPGGDPRRSLVTD
jgi:hypothetical protein